MEQGESVMQVKELSDMRLMALLRELVRDHGRKKAAAILGVDRRTLDAGMDAGVLSRRMRRALDKALQSGAGTAAAEQRDRNDRLEERLGELGSEVETLGKEMRRRMAALEGGVAALRRDDTGGTGAGHDGAGPLEDSVRSGQGERPPPRYRVRREYPTLVTFEPADDDEEVFGDAWPLIAEWRQIRITHPNEGKGFKWLTERKRLFEVELALLEEHGMTLPPEKQPLHGLDRSGQTNWRWATFYDTRKAWFWRWRVRQVLRFVTFGRCWRELPSDAGSIPLRNQRRSG